MDTKLHILFLCGWYPSRVLPTNGDFIQRHAEAVSLVHKVSVLHIVSDQSCKEDIEIVSKINKGIHTHIGYIRPSKNPIWKIYLFLKAYQQLLLRIEAFDLIHLNTLYPFGLFALHQKKKNKIPFIISEHWTGYHKPQVTQLTLIRKLISKRITQKAAFICPVSNDLKKSMKLFGLKGTYKRVPNVIDTDLFLPKEKTNQLFTILHASNMVNDHKNIEGILRVVARLQHKINPFVFKLIGENAAQYQLLAKQLKIKPKVLIIKNHILHKEVAQELNASNLFILFSNYENLPCVILEAFSTGTPVISTNVGGIDEYFPANFGSLIEKENEDELFDKIVTFYKGFSVDQHKMHAYVQEHFSKKKIAQEFTKIYELSLNKKN
ncbi:glycosyltransferase family 4 protein [Polaribacter sp. HL-MS24]|uniref:glycosyltransferase family 4 protein n=1 Tax=Polaribacter sp. HL-MS24 TaxID=3077735 RepID=UPI0029343BA6|nr:glycosyltransferase family 4 protein [Polaribacter sp. HL-MS24]WOC40785.1 glycosyltransferase family 4 protein [Polaribacter sp. HL-MS24]